MHSYPDTLGTTVLQSPITDPGTPNPPLGQAGTLGGVALPNTGRVGTKPFRVGRGQANSPAFPFLVCTL